MGRRNAVESVNGIIALTQLSPSRVYVTQESKAALIVGLTFPVASFPALRSCLLGMRAIKECRQCVYGHQAVWGLLPLTHCT